LPPLVQPVRKDIFQQAQDEANIHRLFALQQQVDELEREINETGGMPQYPGKTVPWAFSALYGPIPILATRRNDSGAGTVHLAPLVSTTTPYLPRNRNLLVGRDGAYYWCAANVAGYYSWTYTSDPGTSVAVPAIVPVRNAVADIFDPVFPNNGGAEGLQNFAAFCCSGFANPHVCFEVDLYDKKRGRSLTDGKCPPEPFMGLTYGFQEFDSPQRFQEDTELEPRLFVTDAGVLGAISAPDTDAVYNASSVAFYVNLALRGYRVLPE
jgi:hypothetical protein